MTRDSTVTVNNQPTERQGDYFRKEVALANSSSAAWTSLTNLAVLNDGTNPDITETNIGFAFLPQTPQSFLHDADGNLTNDGQWSFSWDVENRLTNITSLPGLPPEAKHKLDIVYDHLGRRIQKSAYKFNGSSYTLDRDERFIWDGWNLMAVINSSRQPQLTFQWGTDASGTMQGAGGVGGLLSMTVHTGPQVGTYFYCFDGNFNVVALVSAATGAVVAEYEYGPFGELIRATGPLAKVNPFMFSTKYHDWETGMYYYGFRYYNPSTGRWLSRDPIGERGGLNLYGFVLNRPVKLFDHLGLDFQDAEMVRDVTWFWCWALKCRSVIRDSMWAAHKWANETYGYPGQMHGNAGSIADMFTHCVGACEVAKGEAACKNAGIDARKFLQDRENGGVSADDKMDLENNRLGFEIADSGKDCKAGCRHAFTDSKLWTIIGGKAQPIGPPPSQNPPIPPK